MAELTQSPWYHFALAIRKSAAKLNELEARQKQQEEAAKQCPGNRAGQ